METYQEPKSRQLARNVLLPLAAVFETIATAKATQGQHTGQTALGLMNVLDQQNRFDIDQREKAIERASQAAERKADRDFKTKEFKLKEDEQKESLSLKKLTGGREEAEFQAKEDKDHRALVDRDKAIARMLGIESSAPTLDESTNTITMGNKGKPGLPDLTPLDREKIQINPEKFAFEKNALTDFMAKWDYQVNNPKPTKGGQAGEGKLNLSEGQKAIDRKFGQEYADFFASGGIADAQKGIQQIDDVIGELGGGANLSGPFVGSVPLSVRARTMPKSVDVQQRVEELVQRNLRLVLGAQFTEREGMALIQRAYNPALDEKTNASRLRRLQKQMRDAMQAKIKAGEYFNEHGTLSGFPIETLYRSASDFNMESNASSPSKAIGALTDPSKPSAPSSGMLQNPPDPKPTPVQAGPKVGDTKVNNAGMKVRWNGSRWELAQ